MRNKYLSMGMVILLVTLLVSCTTQANVTEQLNTAKVRVLDSIEKSMGLIEKSYQSTHERKIIMTGQNLYDINLDMVRLSDGSEIYVDIDETKSTVFDALYIKTASSTLKVDIPIQESVFSEIFVDEDDNVYCCIGDFSDVADNFHSSLCRVYPSFEYIIDSCEKVILAEKMGVVYIDENSTICQYDFLTGEITTLIEPRNISDEFMKLRVYNNSGFKKEHLNIIEVRNIDGSINQVIILNPHNILDYKVLPKNAELRISADERYLIIYDVEKDDYTLYDVASDEEIKFNGEWIKENDSENDLEFIVVQDKIYFILPKQVVQRDSSFYIFESDLQGNNMIEISNIHIGGLYRRPHWTDAYLENRQLYFIISLDRDELNDDRCAWYLYKYDIDTQKTQLLKRDTTEFFYLQVFFEKIDDDIFVYGYGTGTEGYEPIYVIH